MTDIQEKCISDFGKQWINYRDNDGYYGSLELFKDIIGPLIPLEEFLDAKIAEIGAGTGRITLMMLQAGAKEITAIEPSEAVYVLEHNLNKYTDRVKIEHVTGENMSNGQYDLILSIGVIHHIPEPAKTFESAIKSLKPGGKMLVWVYGKEGNMLYILLVTPIRFITKNLPHYANALISWLLNIPLSLYIIITKFIPLPLHNYMQTQLSPLSYKKKQLVIYDQINPEWAKYYKREEVQALFENAGFVDINLHHRHNYSWTAIATRPNIIIKTI